MRGTGGGATANVFARGLHLDTPQSNELKIRPQVLDSASSAFLVFTMRASMRLAAQRAMSPDQPCRDRLGGERFNSGKHRKPGAEPGGENLGQTGS